MNTYDKSKEFLEVNKLAKWSKITAHEKDVYKDVLVEFLDNNNKVYDTINMKNGFVIEYRENYEAKKGNGEFYAFIRQFDESAAVSKKPTALGGTQSSNAFLAENATVSNNTALVTTPGNNISYAPTSSQSTSPGNLIKLLKSYGASVFTTTKHDSATGKTTYLFEAIITINENKKYFTLELNGIIDSFFLIGDGSKKKIEGFFGTKLNPQKVDWSSSPWKGTTGGFDYLVDEKYLKQLIERYGIKQISEGPGNVFKVNDGVAIDATVLDKMEEYYKNDEMVKNSVDSGGTSVFAFEGLGSYYLKDIWKNTDAHKEGRYGALFVVVKGKSVTYVTYKGSTIPDNPLKSSSIVEGIYPYSAHNHNWDYPGMRYNADGNIDTLDEEMPAILPDGSTGTATRISIHAGGNGTTSTWSEGCQIIHYDDYVDFCQIVGFVPEDVSDAKNYKDVTEINSNYYQKYPVDILYIIDRTKMPDWQKEEFHYK